MESPQRGDMLGNRANFKLRQQRVQEWLGIVENSRSACERLTATSERCFPSAGYFRDRR
jgi:hypothetical protein